MAKSVDIIDLISTSLDSGQFKDALNIFNEEKHESFIRDNCGDLITVVVEKIQDDTLIIKPSLHGACEQMLSLIVEKCTPEEILLEFIERIELAKNDAQFGIILPSLQQLLKKLTSKRVRSLEWCLNSISTYIENIPVTEHELEGDERKLLDSDSNFRRITKVYSMLPSFYQHFIEEYLAVDVSNIQTKEIITAFLICLLGKPMIYIDVDPNANERSEARQVCCIILQDICKLERNVLKFLDYIATSLQPEKPQKDYEEDISPYEYRYKINMTTLSCLFYCVYSGHFELPVTATPLVYSNDYINNSLIKTVNHLLNFSEYGPLSKGLSLSGAFTNRLSSNTSHTTLSLSDYYELCKNLSNVAIFSTFLTIRRNAVTNIASLINKFDYKGRCMLIKYLIKSSNHSGMIGFVIGQYKNTINEAFSDPVMSECFRGAQLKSMIKKICFLPQGAESDLMELGEQIIASLNFLRFLILKDVNNVTGVRDMFPTIETEYLEVLRVALKMSKAHYELKIKDMKEGKNLLEEDSKVSVSVGETALDSMPPENKIKVLEQALNGFHLLESLVARVSELL